MVYTGAMSRLRSGLQDFHQLMRYRIMDILLVASPYDSFVLEEAGQIGERVVGEFRNLDLHYGPGLTTVPTGSETRSASNAVIPSASVPVTFVVMCMTWL